METGLPFIRVIGAIRGSDAVPVDLAHISTTFP